tara:strand:- start:3921 stop:4292 length:372 start_codon:yes stop_codon:yes gene_type:complete
MESYIVILTALVGALGLKEIWKIIKSKVDHSSNLEEKQIDFAHEVVRELKNDNEKLQTQLNKQQKMMVDHERKIAELLVINKLLHEKMDACASKMEKMESRLMRRATSSAKRPTSKKATKSKT